MLDRKRLSGIPRAFLLCRLEDTFVLFHQSSTKICGSIPFYNGILICYGKGLHGRSGVDFQNFWNFGGHVVRGYGIRLRNGLWTGTKSGNTRKRMRLGNQNKRQLLVTGGQPLPPRPIGEIWIGLYRKIKIVYYITAETNEQFYVRKTLFIIGTTYLVDIRKNQRYHCHLNRELYWKRSEVA